MKLYFKHFKIFFILLIVCGVITGIVAATLGSREKPEIVRTNKECLQTARVFDYGELLTDEEEAKLEAQIAKRQDECACDIILVTLNREITGQWTGLRDWADDFYDENLFGYDKPHGDGILLVDNWYSFGNYNGDTWLSTSGKAESGYSSSQIDDLLDEVCSIVNDDPYRAYSLYVDEVAKHLTPGIGFMKVPAGIAVIIALIVSAIYFCVHFFKAAAKDTTTPYTYVTNGAPETEEIKDLFLHKSVHKTKIESSSGGGGGGHHVSSGGFSHGGGGHHH
ncbi:MAG: TPM domain-containing protein [Lachnospiraceae bacterium]|nr:TPM domain-containing protein [Lachnospiraceae bacterium]